MQVGEMFMALGLVVEDKKWNLGQAVINRLAGQMKQLAVNSVLAKTDVSQALKTIGLNGVKLGMDLETLRKKADDAGGSFSTLKGIIAGVAVTYAGAFVKNQLVGFNATVEDTKLQIAGMLALTKKTDLADQVQVADNIYAKLQKRAASLPGTTAEYTQMLGMLAQPVTKAGLGLQDLEDITVNGVVAAKALGVEWQDAARDISQALSGQFNADDVLTGKLLGSIGYSGEAGRKKFRALSQKKQAEELKRALTQKQLGQLAEAQGKTFNGILSTLQDSIQQFFGKVGKPLFESLTAGIKDANAWLDANKQKVDEMAASIGGKIATAAKVAANAFLILINVLSIAANHWQILVALFVAKTAVQGVMALTRAIIFFQAAQTAAALASIKNWILILGPIALFAAAFLAIGLVVYKFRDKIADFFRFLRDALKAAGSWISELPSKIGDAFSNAFDAIVQEAKDLPGRIWRAIKQFGSDLWEGAAGGPTFGELMGMDAETRAALAADLNEQAGPAPARAVREFEPPGSVGTTSAASTNNYQIQIDAKSADAVEVGRIVQENIREYDEANRRTMAQALGVR